MLVGRRFGPRAVTSWPAISMRPVVGVRKPAIMLRSVVLPQPEGPRIARKSRRRMSRSRGWTAAISPNVLDTPAKRTSRSDASVMGDLGSEDWGARRPFGAGGAPVSAKSRAQETFPSLEDLVVTQDIAIRLGHPRRVGAAGLLEP